MSLMIRERRANPENYGGQRTAGQILYLVLHYTGNDGDTAAVCMLGGSGVISVAANVLPREMHQLTEACRRNDYALAGQLQLKLRRLIEVLFCEVNPIPVKTAMHLMGYCEEILRLPLCQMSPEHRAVLAETLEAYGVECKVS